MISHGPTHQTIHPPMGGEISTDFKSSNEIEILICLSFFAFLLIWATYSSGGGDRGGGYLGVWGCHHMHAHTHAHVKHANKHDTHVGSHLQFLHMYILG